MIRRELIRGNLRTIPEDMLIKRFLGRAPTVLNTTVQKANCAPKKVVLTVMAENNKVHALISLSEQHDQ